MSRGQFMPSQYHRRDCSDNPPRDFLSEDNHDMTTLAERIKLCREEKQISQAQLAKLSGIANQSIVGMLETGARKKTSHLPAIARALGVEVLWLQYGEGARRRADAPAPLVSPGEARQAIRRAHFRLSAGVSGYEIEYENGESEPIFMARRWFDQHHYRPESLVAVKVTGRSMEPSLYDGDLVVINTEDITPKDGVVFAANYEGELVIKRLRRDAGEWFLVSDSPDKRYYADKRCSDGCGLIGRIVYRQTEHI